MTLLVVLGSILLIECILMLVALVVAAALAQEAIKTLNETKVFADQKEREIMDFINEKQAFVEKLQSKIEHSTLGTFLNL